LKRRIALFSTLAVAYFTSADAAEPSPEEFAYGLKAITTGEAAAYRASLPLVVYQKVVRADLGDLRVFNESGEVVPYALERPRSETTVQQPATPLPVFTLRGDAGKALDAVRLTIESGGTTVNVQVPGGRATVGARAAAGAAGAVSATTPENPITGYVLDGRPLDAPVAALQIAWPDDAADFAGRVQVEASEDLGAWRQVVAGAPVANLRAGDARLIERRVELPPTRSRFWRLSWAGAAAPFEITNVVAEPARDRVDVERATLAVEGSPVQDERAAAKPGETKPGEFEFDLGAQLPVDRVNIELPEQNSVVEVALFSRAAPKDPWRPITRSGFYRLKSAGADLTNGAIVVDRNADRYWLARADMRSAGLGRGTPKLSVGWIPHEVVFLARGAGPFTLAYGSGSADGATAPLGSIPPNVTIGRAELAEPHVLGGDSRLSPSASAQGSLLQKSTLLWAALVLGVALLTYMAYRLAKELK
jgi:hypothetical protein